MPTGPFKQPAATSQLSPWLSPLSSIDPPCSPPPLIPSRVLSHTAVGIWLSETPTTQSNSTSPYSWAPLSSLPCVHVGRGCAHTKGALKLFPCAGTGRLLASCLAVLRHGPQNLAAKLQPVHTDAPIAASTTRAIAMGTCWKPPR